LIKWNSKLQSNLKGAPFQACRHNFVFWYYSIQYLCVLNWTLIYYNNMLLIYLWVPKVRWKIWIFIVECSNEVFSSWCCWDWVAADVALLCVYWYIISVTATILWDHYDLHETMDRLPIFVILLSYLSKYTRTFWCLNVKWFLSISDTSYSSLMLGY
jgi:hypothetical protein